MKVIGVLGAWLVCATPSAVAIVPRVVINEVMYHPPEDWEGLQFLELHNPGTHGVDLSGWSLTNGIRFVFPRETQLPAGGCIVVCHDLAALRARWGAEVSVAGVFAGTLSHRGERVELADAQGRLVDAVEYGDGQLWPQGADGYGASLERICPVEAGDDPANWAASEVPPGGNLGGTPGCRNACFSPVPLPRIADVRCSGAQPGALIPVSAAVSDTVGVRSVNLNWQVLNGEGAPTWTTAPMRLQSGDARQGVYAGQIPAQPEGRLIRFTIRAASASGAERLCPPRTEPRPTFSCATFVNTNTARIPFLRVLTLGAVERPVGTRRIQAQAESWGGKPAGPPLSWGSAALCMPPGGTEVRLFDHVHVRPRKGGLKIHFLKDQPFEGMTGINVIFEDSPRWILAEPLAYEVYRLAGVPAPMTQHARLWVDELALGYHLVIEQPNKAFLQRQGRDVGGNVYKLLWYGQGLVGQHEKKTNPHTGHTDLVRLVEGLNHTSGAAQWEFIQQNFNVDEMIDYYAVNMCIQNWDGFFNNYFAYHDLRPGGKWEIFPWDEDKTWGDYDGVSPRYDWYEMPLTMGMNGDNSVKRSWFSGWPVPGAEWWRPGGYFSGPLLANPEFRRRFLSRLKAMCETTFTPEKMNPIIEAMEHRLGEEVGVQAELKHQDRAAAVREFQNDMQSFRNQVVNRRKFILQQLEAGR